MFFPSPANRTSDNPDWEKRDGWSRFAFLRVLVAILLLRRDIPARALGTPGKSA